MEVNGCITSSLTKRMHSILSFDLPLMGGFPTFEVSRWLGRHKRVTPSSPCKQVQQLRRKLTNIRTNQVH